MQCGVLATASAVCIQGLQALQPRILAWLGRVGGSAAALAGATAASSQALVAATASEQTASADLNTAISARWDPQDKLLVTVALPQNQRLTIALDRLLPQVGLLVHMATGHAVTCAVHGLQAGSMSSRLAVEIVDHHMIC